MKKELLGGPLLGERGADDATQTATQTKRRFEPLITPVVGTSRNNTSTAVKPEQFILLPQERFIQVLAFKTGAFVANLVPFGKDSKKDAKIESVCLATYPSKPRTVIDIFDHIQTGDDESEQPKAVKKRRKEDEGLVDHVVLVGCSDGTLREFSLVTLLASSCKPGKAQPSLCGPWNLKGPCYGPRRMFKVTSTQTKLRHLTAPSCVLASTEYGLLAYALIENHKEEFRYRKMSLPEASTSFSLIRLVLPPYFDNSIMEKKRFIPLCKGGKQGTSSRVESIGKISCDKQALGDGKYLGSSPFCLQSVVRDRTQGLLPGVQFTQQNVFIVIGRPTATHVFCERLSDISVGLDDRNNKKRYPPVMYRSSGMNRFCSLAISVNKNDLALGHEKGDIVILSSFLSRVESHHWALEKYESQVGASGSSKEESSSAAVGIGMPDDPFKNVVEAKVHWHAHPVSSLCYDANSPPTDPILYSGGEESVLVTWQPSRGIIRPADVLPRLARRGIAHIGCSKRSPDGSTAGSNDSILVFCEDNTLQLFETHNKMLQWKVQGLAARKGMSKRNADNPPLALDNPAVAIDPMTSASPSPQVLLNGLPDAPGLVQWYDITKQRVVSQLEIAPYNRVSGMEHEDKTPMPAPCVTHLALGSSGNDLMTIEKVPTENRFVGATEAVNEEGDVQFGFVSTVKFWSWNPSAGLHAKGKERSKPYRLVAAMTTPHGAENKVAAIAMSSDGQFACTVSNDEKAFRLWQKVSAGGEEDQDSSGRRLPVWVCQYKVTTPSGYSNHPTGCDAVAFSSDSSVLAVCYGHMLTLWDRSSMTLLTSYHHFDEEDIDSVEFLKSDMILCKSQSGVSIQSPFGTPDLVDVSWCWTVLDKLATVYVSCARFIPGHDVVAISIYYGPINTSRIVLINATTGEPVKGKVGAIIEQVPGIVCSIGQSGPGKIQSNWSDETDTGRSVAPLVLYALTNQGVLIALSEGSDTPSLTIESDDVDTTSNAPRLPSSADQSNEPAKKRRRVGARPARSLERSHDKRVSMINFGSTLEESGIAVPLPSSELPLLGGSFAKAFVGRNLSRRKQAGL